MTVSTNHCPETTPCYSAYSSSLFPFVSTRLIISDREGMLQTSSARDLHLVGPRWQAFSAVAPTLWNILSPEIRLAPSLAQKSLKTWLCHQTWSFWGIGDISQRLYCIEVYIFYTVEPLKCIYSFSLMAFVYFQF